MDRDFEYKRLNDLRIHELRDLARLLHVKSPTSQKKDVLIENIMAIQSGNAEPYVPKNHKGRPVRKSIESNNLVDYFMPNDLNKNLVKYNDVSQQYNLECNVSMPKFEYNSQISFDPVKVSGYADVSDGDYGIIRVNGFNVDENDVYINNSFITKYNIKSGDYIVAMAQKQSIDKPRTVIEINLINNKTPQEEVDDFTFEFCKPHKPLKIGKTKIMLGTSAIVLNNARNTFANSEDFAKQFIKDNNVEVVVVAPVTENMVKEEKAITYATFNIAANYINAFSAYKIATGKVNTLSESKDVVLVLTGIGYFIKGASILISNKEVNPYKIEEAARKLVIDIITGAKAHTKGSLTVVIYESNKQDQKTLELIKYDLGNIANVCLEKNGNDFIEF